MSEIQSRYSKKYKFFIWILLIGIGSFFIFAFGIESIFTTVNNQNKNNEFFSINGRGVYNEPASIVSEIYTETVTRYRRMGMNIDEQRFGNMIYGQAIDQAKSYLAQSDYAEKNKLFLSDEELLYFLQKKRQGGISILDSIKNSLKNYSKANQIALGKQEYFKTVIQNAYLNYTEFIDIPVSSSSKKIISDVFSVKKEATIIYKKISDDELIKDISLTDLKKYYDSNKQNKYQNKKYEKISASLIQKDYLNDNKELLFNKASLPIKTALEKEMKSKKFKKNFLKIAKKNKLDVIKTEVSIDTETLIDRLNDKKILENAKKSARNIMMTPSFTNTSLLLDDNLIAVAMVGKMTVEKPNNLDELIEKEQTQLKNAQQQLFVNALRKKAKIIDNDQKQ